jgi:hypothetical protein
MMDKYMPYRKVQAATAGAALGELIGGVIEANTSIEGLSTSALTVLCAFVLGWLIPEKQ